jgi:hypothetical protein
MEFDISREKARRLRSGLTAKLAGTPHLSETLKQERGLSGKKKDKSPVNEPSVFFPLNPRSYYENQKFRKNSHYQEKQSFYIPINKRFKKNDYSKPNH